MENRKKIFFIIAVSLQITTFVQAQDLHFSQFFNAPRMQITGWAPVTVTSILPFWQLLIKQ
jgi:hypothetical protein